MSDKYALAYNTWQEKTEWVQIDKRFDVLLPWGKHRADVLKEYIEHIEAKLDEALRYGRQADATIHNLELKLTDMAVQLANAESKCRELAAESGVLKKAAEFATAPDMWIEQADGMLDVHISNGHDVGQGWWDGDTWQTQHDYYSVPGDVTHWLSLPAAPKQENTMDYITMLSPKLVSIGMFEQLSFHDDFSLKCRELGIHASKLGHVELSKKANDLMFSASLQQHDQLVDNMASLIELMADNYMRNTANYPVTPDAWIPVSEWMPEIRKDWLDTSVIIAVRGEKDGAEAMYCSDGKFRWGRDEQPIEYVTHWMPLPAAPQPEVK